MSGPRAETLKSLSMLLMLCAACSTVTGDFSGNAAFTARIESPTSVRIGDSLRLTFVAVNTQSATVSLSLGSDDQSFNPTVRDSVGNYVWSRLGGQFLSGTGELVSVPPYGELRFNATWDLRDYQHRYVQPGKYFITGGVELDAGRVIVAANAPRAIVVTRQ